MNTQAFSQRLYRFGATMAPEIVVVPYDFPSYGWLCFLWFLPWCTTSEKNKAWESYCYSSHRLRSSHYPVLLNEQRRSPRRRVNTSTRYHTKRYGNAERTTHHARIHRRLVPYNTSMCEISICKNKRSKRRNICLIPMLSPPSGGLLQENGTKVVIFF